VTAIVRRATGLVAVAGICVLAMIVLPATASAAQPCGLNMVWAGEAGEVNASRAPSGFVRWGARSYTDNGGLWVAYVLVGRRTVDKKVQDYQPHGSVNPKDLRTGQLLKFLVYHVDTQGKKSLSRPDAECVIP